MRLEDRVKALIVRVLRMDRAPESIADDLPMFDRGLGLDSIDALELALAISKKYGFKLQSDDKMNTDIFRSLRSLSSHIEQHRAT